MARMWALMAVGAGPDEGTSWVLATGSREDVLHRARVARIDDAVPGASTGLRPRIAALTLVPADHPSLRRAHRDVEVAPIVTSGVEDRKAG